MKSTLRKGVFYWKRHHMLSYILAAVTAAMVFVVAPPGAVEEKAAGVAEAHAQAAESSLTAVTAARSSQDHSGSVSKTLSAWVTAYSSTPEETDETPFLTARNTEVRDGIVATNFLPFGTRIMIPERFGQKVFIVEDRMHRRKTNFVDVWMSTKEAAKEFGISFTTIVVLEKGHNAVASVHEAAAD
ncbi:MAG: 3D domain-containing protein [Candidatus Brennerbacteria bacterium]|nr:3D domain-containing protein [Candidatus Brennerbacteria bacterium]